MAYCEINHLIELLEKRSCLWDVFDKNYHIREIREKAFRESELELDTPVPEIKAIIMSLRSQLGRDIAKMTKTKSGQSTSEVYRPSWVFWERLQFLCPLMQPGKSRDNCQSQSSQGTFSDSENSTTPKTSGVDNDDRDIGISKRTKPVGRKSKDDKKQELFDTCISILKEPVVKPDQCHFSLYVTETLSKFSKRTRAIAEKRISDMLLS